MWERVRIAVISDGKKSWREPFLGWIWGAWLVVTIGVGKLAGGLRVGKRGG